MNETDQTDETDRTEALSYSLSFSSDVVRSSREESYSAKTGIAPEWRQPIFSLVYLVSLVDLVCFVYLVHLVGLVHLVYLVVYVA